MRKIITMSSLSVLISLLAGCATSPPAPVVATLTPEQAAANRAAINQIDDEDRSRDHVERMRQVEAIERLNRSEPLQTIIIR